MEKNERLVTQQMVADESGYHYSTVSLALRNHPRIPEATRRAIHAAARKLGYAPNPLVSLLMARVRRRRVDYRGTLAYLHTATAEGVRAIGLVYRNFAAGARMRAEELGYRLEEFFLDGRIRPERLADIWRARGVQGVVVAHVPGPAVPERRLPMDLADWPAVALGAPLAYPALHAAANDQYMRPILAVREVAALGYRRPGCLIEESHDAAMTHRCSAGFWAVQEYCGNLERVPLHRFRAEPGAQEGVLTWLKEHRPDVVLSSVSPLLPVIRRAGFRVPVDLGWVHLDLQPGAKGMAGVYGNSERTGRAAVELVVSQLHRGEMGPPAYAMNFLVNGTWRPGPSVRRVGPPVDLDRAFFRDLERVTTETAQGLDQRVN